MDFQHLVYSMYPINTCWMNVSVSLWASVLCAECKCQTEVQIQAITQPSFVVWLLDTLVTELSGLHYYFMCKKEEEKSPVMRNKWVNFREDNLKCFEETMIL